MVGTHHLSVAEQTANEYWTLQRKMLCVGNSYHFREHFLVEIKGA